MRSARIRVAVVSMAVFACPGLGAAMTMELDAGEVTFVSPGDTWRFFRGTEAPSTQAEAWAAPDFNDSPWDLGPGGFGYGDSGHATALSNMRGNYLSLYIRRAFTVSAPLPDQALELTIDYDDGFIAYLNGKEVARRQMPAGPATYKTTASASHESGTAESIVLGRARDLLVAGVNVLAIEGHNNSKTSSDFMLIPALRTQGDAIRNGGTWIVDTNTVTIRGRTQAAGAASVTLQGDPTAFDPAQGTWAGQVVLAGGLNTITARALDADANAVDSNSMDIVYVPAANHVTGVLDANALWSGAYVLEGTLTVPAGRVLTLDPGTWVLMGEGAEVLVQGQLLANGTEASPIRLTHHGDATWRHLLFAQAGPSRLAHCTIEYGGSAGSHTDYYEPSTSRSYHEAVVVLATHVDIEGCTLQNLPTNAEDAEGDGLAIISDDPNAPGEASAHIWDSRFLGIGQGIHTRYAHVLVEHCYFQDKRGDNDDIDLYGESTPPPVIRYNLFDLPEHDDRINPTRCSAIIIGNVIKGGDDHGIVLRDRGSPVVMNNLIMDCASGGIAVENSCTALLVNNTIVGCGRGLRLFDLGRWGAPYRLNPGGGTATAVNCVIWDCPQPITLADSSNTTVADRGSHITLSHCNVQGGQAGISVSGSHSTVTWGEGNSSVDPLFLDPKAGDHHLQALSPLIDKGTPDLAPGTDLDGNLRPCGGGFDMGAYEFGPCPPDPNWP
ncbi:MAG: right-handed parallel beta-helix repeat-containing protein [Phycisphaerae bacterium]|nr:right-handed parallel beta-helix repeat-containing protein [Phycisphaerae bacterium]